MLQIIIISVLCQSLYQRDVIPSSTTHRCWIAQFHIVKWHFSLGAHPQILYDAWASRMRNDHEHFSDYIFVCEVGDSFMISDSDTNEARDDCWSSLFCRLSLPFTTVVQTPFPVTTRRWYRKLHTFWRYDQIHKNHDWKTRVKLNLMCWF